ncbi:hypothetical protein NL676_025110 [Syzygium grande]|nr:hypothetical protein NL676_025110 [Syzygium grande]
MYGRNTIYNAFAEIRVGDADGLCTALAACAKAAAMVAFAVVSISATEVLNVEMQIVLMLNPDYSFLSNSLHS